MHSALLQIASRIALVVSLALSIGAATAFADASTRGEPTASVPTYRVQRIAFDGAPQASAEVLLESELNRQARLGWRLVQVVSMDREAAVVVLER